MAKTEQVPVQQVSPSDVLSFAGSEYKVRSVIVKSDHVKIAYWETNDMQPYFYETDAVVERVVG